MTEPFKARVFVVNPGGAYDPAPLEDLDMTAAGSLPGIGDFIYQDYSANRTGVYQVVSRHWEGKDVGIVVKEVDMPLDSPFGARG